MTTEVSLHSKGRIIIHRFGDDLTCMREVFSRACKAMSLHVSCEPKAIWERVSAAGAALEADTLTGYRLACAFADNGKAQDFSEALKRELAAAHKAQRIQNLRSIPGVVLRSLFHQRPSTFFGQTSPWRRIQILASGRFDVEVVVRTIEP